MIRNKQRIYIKRAFKNSTFINEDNEEITYLALLRKELKKYNISIYVFREWIYQRNKNPKCQFRGRNLNSVPKQLSLYYG